MLESSAVGPKMGWCGQSEENLATALAYDPMSVLASGIYGLLHQLKLRSYDFGRS